MITMYPVIMPLITNKTDTNLVQECLESEGNSDILKKYLAQEDFSEDDIDRMTKCVEDKRSVKNTVKNILVVVLVAVGIFAIGFAIWTIFFDEI